MRYQHIIKNNAVPQWLSFYMNYKLLKKIIFPYTLTYRGKYIVYLVFLRLKLALSQYNEFLQAINLDLGQFDIHFQKILSSEHSKVIKASLNS